MSAVKKSGYQTQRRNKKKRRGRGAQKKLKISMKF
jgi:hypothetical protein